MAHRNMLRSVTCRSTFTGRQYGRILYAGLHLCVSEPRQHCLLIGIIHWKNSDPFKICSTSAHMCDYLSVCVRECAGDTTTLSCLFSLTPGWPGLIRCPDYPAWPATINPSETPGPLNSPFLIHTHTHTGTEKHVRSFSVGIKDACTKLLFSF